MAPKILYRDDPVLRTHAVEVPVADISSEEIQTLIKDMYAVLREREDSVAIAAPQLGISKRIFVVAPRVFSDPDAEKPAEDGLVCINPEITKESRKRDVLEEGCLSIPECFGHVPRARKVTLRAYNERGETFTRGASGLLAQIFQHEIDHLNGILFTDKAEETWKPDTIS